MAITNFIPTVWGESLYNKLNSKYVGVANCTREWEGDIKQCGDRVKICGLEPVSIFNYTKNSDLPAPAVLSDNARELVINQAKAFNFQIDDVDAAQSMPNLMDAAIRQAAAALASEADKYVYSVAAAECETAIIKAEDNNIVDGILGAMLTIRNKGVTDDLILEVSPKVASIIYKEKLNMVSDNSEAFENGYLGAVAGCKIYVSNNIMVENAGPSSAHACIMRTKRALAFAEQLSEIEAYRPELRFADAVKGLHLYGAKVVRHDEILAVRVVFGE